MHTQLQLLQTNNRQAIHIALSSMKNLSQIASNDYAEACVQQEKLLGKNAQDAAYRRQFVMDYFGEEPLIRNAGLYEGLDVSPATANRILRELNEDGTLKRVRIRQVLGVPCEGTNWW